MDAEGGIFLPEQANISATKQAYRIYSEGIPCNNKVYSESETQAKVLNNTKHFRDKMKFYYERIPDERIHEFAVTR